jgi:hypothetical protein
MTEAGRAKGREGGNHPGKTVMGVVRAWGRGASLKEVK